MSDLMWWEYEGEWVYELDGVGILRHEAGVLHCIPVIKEMRSRFPFGLKECKEAWDARKQIAVPGWWRRRKVLRSCLRINRYGNLVITGCVCPTCNGRGVISR
jgi:hypothetical protein